MNIEKLVRPAIRQLLPYSSAREEFTGSKGVFLDANENPYGPYNRYPDPFQTELKRRLAEIKSVPVNNIFLGNGSDEVIDLSIRIFCRPNRDRVLSFYPTYGMYEVLANLNEVEMIKLPLEADFQINIEALKPYLQDTDLKIIFICSPNNPTGNNLQGIDFILNNFKGLVIVDEAYIDFSGRASWSTEIHRYPNLIVLQTLSKSYGLAGLRIGMALSNDRILAFFNKIKPPYNISSINQDYALRALSNTKKFKREVEETLMQREYLFNELSKLSPLITKVYPSEANFLLLEVKDANWLYETLMALGIITPNRHSVIENTIRVTVGTPQENSKLIDTLKKLYEENIICRS